MTWRDMKVCRQHRLKYEPWCPSCQAALDWMIWRQFCHCGAAAVGYVYTPNEPLKFYCDEHFPTPKALVNA